MLSEKSVCFSIFDFSIGSQSRIIIITFTIYYDKKKPRLKVFWPLYKIRNTKNEENPALFNSPSFKVKKKSHNKVRMTLPKLNPRVEPLGLFFVQQQIQRSLKPAGYLICQVLDSTYPNTSLEVVYY